MGLKQKVFDQLTMDMTDEELETVEDMWKDCDWIWMVGAELDRRRVEHQVKRKRNADGTFCVDVPSDNLLNL